MKYIDKTDEQFRDNRPKLSRNHFFYHNKQSFYSIDAQWKHLKNRTVNSSEQKIVFNDLHTADPLLKKGKKTTFFFNPVSKKKEERVVVEPEELDLVAIKQTKKKLVAP